MEQVRRIWKRMVSTAAAHPRAAVAVVLILLLAWWMSRRRSLEGFQTATSAAAAATGGETTLMSPDVPGVTLSPSLCPSFQAFVDQTQKDIETYTASGAIQSLQAAKAGLEVVQTKMRALGCDRYVAPPAPAAGTPPPAITIAPEASAAL